MRILLIEDDRELNQILAYQLRKEGFTVDICEDGEDALYYMKQNAYELILLDRMLPHIDGLTLLKKLRQQGSNIPVIILTALGEIDDRVTGLDSGADDYLVKPFDFEELMARIRCINRRPRQWEESSTLSFSDITYLPGSHKLHGPLGNCTLSKREGALMDFFIHNPEQVLPRETILLRIWGPEGEVEDGNLDNYIHFIRRRLSSVSESVLIKTIRGIGYQLEEKESCQ